MDRYIGLDAHSTTCTLATVGPSGRHLGRTVVETRGEALVEAVRAVPGRRRLCLEEGTLAGWMVELLEPHVHELVVAGVAGIRGTKSDEKDAFALAQALRLGAIDKRVYKAPKRFRKLRELARTYRMVVSDVVRSRNRIKSVYRSRGIPTAGRSVYSPSGRGAFLEQLNPASRQAATTLYAMLDAQLEVRDAAEGALLAEAQRHSACKLLKTAPGFGDLRVAQLVPIVVTPHRFRTSRQFWSYCGLAVVTRSSSDWVQEGGRWVRRQVPITRGLTRSYNRTLKWLYKGAATTVITQLPSCPLRIHYQHLLREGTKPNLAKLTVARRLAALTLSMWRHEEVYDPSRLNTPT